MDKVYVGVWYLLRDVFALDAASTRQEVTRFDPALVITSI